MLIPLAALLMSAPALPATAQELPDFLADAIEGFEDRMRARPAPAQDAPAARPPRQAEAEADAPVPEPRPDELDDETAQTDATNELDAAEQVETDGPDDAGAASGETSRATDAEDEEAPATEAGEPDGPPLPEPRPEVTEEKAEDETDSSEAPDMVSGDEPAQSEPGRIYQAACPAVLSGRVVAEMIEPIEEGTCGLQSPLRVTAVRAGGREVPLSRPATLNCQMATEVANWVGRIDSHSEAIFNTGIGELHTGTSYFCRTRNNAAGADISEHGFGNALDVTGFTLENGRRIGLPANWGNDTKASRAMEHAHSSACGTFTTVLGPEANALHEDHLHLDLGCHGQSCTWRLCE